MQRLKFIYCAFVVCSLKSFITALEYDPPSKTIDVIESGTYTFGIIEVDNMTNIKHCYYWTDTGIEGSFVVVKPEPTTTPISNDLWAVTPEYNYAKNYDTDYYDEVSKENYNTRAENNLISDFGKSGWCTLRVEYVNDAGAKKWTLVAYDEVSDKNLTSVDFQINFFYKVPLLVDKRIVVQETSSFIQHLNTDIKFVDCKLKFNQTEIDLNLNSIKTNIFLAPYSLENEGVADKISSLGEGICGFKLLNAAKEDTLNWSLTAISADGKPYRAIFDSAVFDKDGDDVLHQKVEVTVGDWHIVTCGSKYDHEFCSVYHPSGKLTYSLRELRDCTYSIRTVSVEDLGIWKCFAGVAKTMETLDYSVELVQKGSESVETWVDESENYVTIGCRIVNPDISTMSFCKITAPNKQTFNIHAGSATNRYLSLGTSLEKRLCVLKIEKPLQDFEKGPWLCEIVRGGTRKGGFVNVAITETPDYPKYIKVTAQFEQPLIIACEVPYSSDYCHIKAPNGTIYPTNNEYESLLGKCEFHIEKITFSDNGTWSCSFARETGTPDDQIFVEVTVAEMLTYYKLTEVSSGDNAQIMCRSGGLPLKYCRFIAPSGVAYQIHTNQTSNTISYYGRGLEYGECGITISKAQVSDTGYWTCITRIGGYNHKEISANIFLDVSQNILSDTNLAATIGIAVGVVVVSSVIGVVAVRKWQQRRHTELSGNSPITRPRTNDEDRSQHSDTDLFSMAPLPRSYTNPTTVRDEENHDHQL